MGLLDGKVALVTGAGGGLGRTHALLLAQGRRRGRGQRSRRRAGRHRRRDRDGRPGRPGDPGRGRPSGRRLRLGVRRRRPPGRWSSAPWTSSASSTSRSTNAGILRDKSFKNMTDEMWDIVMDVHLRGTYLVTKAAYDRMIEQESGGRIVMTSSTSGLLGNFGQTNYGAAKAGMAGFMRCLALEGAKYGVTVNLLAPAAWSRLTEDIMPEATAEPLAPEKGLAGGRLALQRRRRRHHRPHLRRRRQTRSPCWRGSRSRSPAGRTTRRRGASRPSARRSAPPPPTSRSRSTSPT